MGGGGGGGAILGGSCRGGLRGARTTGGMFGMGENDTCTLWGSSPGGKWPNICVSW